MGHIPTQLHQFPVVFEIMYGQTDRHMPPKAIPAANIGSVQVKHINTAYSSHNSYYDKHKVNLSCPSQSASTTQ